MEPNKWGLLRHRVLDLLAVPSTAGFTSASEYDITELEYDQFHDSAFINNAGSIVTGGIMQCIEYDISSYDAFAVFTFIPATSTNNVPVLFMKDSGGNNLYQIQTVLYGGVSRTASASCTFFGVRKTEDAQLFVNCSRGATDYVALGFRRHRSDGVNPLGIIQPINPGLLHGLNDPDADINPVDPDPEEEA